ncbi:MAG: hypothetical protein ACK5LP_03395 [Campylobacteraceae bacterium]
MKKILSIFVLIFLFFTQSFAEVKTEITLSKGEKLVIVEEDFDAVRFNIKNCKSGEADIICTINNRLPFGTDGDIPKTYLKSLSVIFGDKTFNLDTSNMYNAWNDRHLFASANNYFGVVCYESEEIYCVFRGVFGDAAGSYTAEWIASNDKVTRTILTNQIDVINFMMNNLEAPEFE